jgi:lipopolysaccharide cholinephosphotransferase
MDKDTLRQVQIVQLEMLKEIKRVCTILNIPYFLDSGTLLGAVRHQGFIPWDDDLDIGMTRNNYQKFITEAPAILSDKYHLQTWHNDANYGVPFAKLRKVGTVYIEEVSEKVEAEAGIYVDIFPYNAMPEKPFLRKKQGRRCEILRRLVLIKCNYSPWKATGSKGEMKKIIYAFGKVIVIFLTKEWLVNKYETSCMEFEGKEVEYLFPSAAVNYGEFIIKRDYLDDLIPLRFEDDVFLCSRNYDAVLRTAYGDYMKLPPVDQRGNRHKIIEISFGEES